MQDCPLVSVVMSVFNVQRFVHEAVSSILNQSLSDFEFIIIDDGSTDGSGKILDVFQKSDPRVAVYHQENKGLIVSLNRGCALARGKYIARMDADDVAIKNRLQWQVDFMESRRDVGVLGGAIEWIDATGRSLLRCRHPIEDRDIKAALGRGDCPFSHPTVLMRKDVLDSVAGYRKSMVHAEDYDLWLRIADRHQLANLEEVVLKYRVHSGQVSVRQCRQQALSNLAARIAASSRKNGKQDPFDSIGDITPEVLSRFGVSEAKQQTSAVRGSLSCIRSMCEAGEYGIALKEMHEVLRSYDVRLVASPEMADLRLLAARLYWHEGRLTKSVLNAGHALLTRPKILGRPVKALMRRLGLAGVPGEIITKV